MSTNSETPAPGGQFLVYQAEDGKLKIDVRFEGETVWLTQQHMAELFQRERSVITKHIRNIFEEGELVEEAVCANFARTAADGKTYQTMAYNLDVIISVGYRVKSLRGTQFRIWATQRLREYIVKGFLLDDERLKNPDLPFDYYEELMRRIQDIRTSERRFYQKITDIYATSIDYDPTQEVSLLFFKTVQNKVHWAITGQTAAEIVHGRVDVARRGCPGSPAPLSFSNICSMATPRPTLYHGVGLPACRLRGKPISPAAAILRNISLRNFAIRSATVWPHSKIRKHSNRRRVPNHRSRARNSRRIAVYIHGDRSLDSRGGSRRGNIAPGKANIRSDCRDGRC